MSATIPSTKLVSDLLKPTGFDCPEDLKGKTFEEATSGGGGGGSGSIKHVVLSGDSTSVNIQGDETMKGETVALVYYDAEHAHSYYNYTYTLGDENASAVAVPNDFAVDIFKGQFICYNNCFMGSGLYDFPVAISDMLEI